MEQSGGSESSRSRGLWEGSSHWILKEILGFNSFLFPRHHEVSSLALPCGFFSTTMFFLPCHQQAQSNRPKDHGLEPLTLWAKVDFPCRSWFCLSVLSQWWDAIVSRWFWPRPMCPSYCSSIVTHPHILYLIIRTFQSLWGEEAETCLAEEIWFL